MSAIVDPVVQTFNEVSKIGTIASDIVREVGHATESIGKEVGKIGQAAINDPIGTIAKVAAVATQQYWALPLISAADVVAHGGNLEQAMISAGVSYAGGAIAAGVGDYLGAGATASIDMAAQDAANMASQGLTASQIAETLQQSYGISSDIATQTAAQSVLGIPASEIASDITSQMSTQNLLANAAGNTAGGAARAALSGGDLNQVLMGGLTSGAGSLAGGYTTQELKDLGLDPTAANALGKATGAATASTIGGKDASKSFINSLINTTLSESGKQVNSELKSIWDDVNKTASTYNDQLAQAQDTYKTTLTPLEQEAKTAQETAATTYDQYKTVKDKFDSIVSDYNTAKDAGDTEKANSLAEQANAMLPELNDATTKYNDTVSTFDKKLASYTSAADEYKKQTDSIASIKAEYDSRAADFQKASTDFTEKATLVADMGDNSKALFGELYNNGTSLEDAFKTVSSLDELKEPAQEAFIRQYVDNNDPTAALDFANKVNGLDQNQLSAYSNAVGTGLDVNSAMQLAPNISGMSQYGQNAYLDALRSGADEQSANTAAALAEMFGERNDQQAAPTEGQTAEQPVPAEGQTAEQPVPAEGTTPSSGNSWLDQLAKLKIPTGTAAKSGTSWSIPARAPTATTTAPADTGVAAGIGAGAAASAPQDMFSGIQNLKGGFTQGSDYQLSGIPNQPNAPQTTNIPVPKATKNMDYTLAGLPEIPQTDSPIPTFATGGTTSDPFNTGIGNTSGDTNGINSALTPSMTKARLDYLLTGMPGSNIQTHADGGSIQGHNPEFYSEGGLSSMENRYVAGEGDGTSDSVPAMLANGEFVIPADIVASLGNGSNEAGASVLDQFLVAIRDHKHSKGNKGLPPDSKGPLSYLTDAKRKVKA